MVIFYFQCKIKTKEQRVQAMLQEQKQKKSSKTYFLSYYCPKYKNKTTFFKVVGEFVNQIARNDSLCLYGIDAPEHTQRAPRPFGTGLFLVAYSFTRKDTPLFGQGVYLPLECELATALCTFERYSHFFRNAWYQL